MKIRLSALASAFVIFFSVLVLSSCPSPLGVAVDDGSSAEVVTVSLDSSRGLVVLTESDGSETVITAVEGNESIGCEAITDYVVFNNSSAGRSLSGGFSPRAVILGVRSDRRPGVWVVYPNGIVVIPRDDDGNTTSELLEAVSEADGFRWDDGWTYDAVALSEDGKIIVGIAENPDASCLTDYLETEPKVVVWWNLIDKGDGVFFLSRARTVAEYPDWNLDDVKFDRNGHGHQWHHRFMQWIRWFLDKRGLWFFAWADNYLGDLAGPKELGDIKPVVIESDGTYAVYGFDKGGDFAKALISPFEVLSIEKSDPLVDPHPKKNRPPWPVTGPAVYQTLTAVNNSFTLVLRDSDNKLLAPGEFDPDGDAVKMFATLKSIDNPAVIPVVTITPEGVFSVAWAPELLYLFATYSVTVSDGEFETPSTVDISVFFDN